MEDELQNIIKAEMKNISEERKWNRKSDSAIHNGIFFGFIFLFSEKNIGQ